MNKKKRQSERVQVTEFSFRQQNKLCSRGTKDNHWQARRTTKKATQPLESKKATDKIKKFKR